MEHPDYRIENHLSIIIVQPLSARCRTWLTQHVQSDAQWFAGGLAVEPRYLDDLLEGMTQEGYSSDDDASRIAAPAVDRDTEDAPDLCPEHGAHTEDYCPGCVERRQALAQALVEVEAQFGDMDELPADIAVHVAAELGKLGFDIVKHAPSIALGVIIEGGMLSEVRSNLPAERFELHVFDADVYRESAEDSGERLMLRAQRAAVETLPFNLDE